MRKTALLLFALLAAVSLHAQTAIPAWQQGVSELNSNWRMQSGDKPAWADPDFDDSAWQPDAFSMNSRIEPGWRWYRLHLNALPAQTPLALLINAQYGTVEVYANGRKLPGAGLRTNFFITRSREQLVPLTSGSGPLTLALRVHIPSASFFSGTWLRTRIGTISALRDAYHADLLDRFRIAFPDVAVNALNALAGIAFLMLFSFERARREYLWLGMYLLLQAIGTVASTLYHIAFIPLVIGWFVSNYSLYLFTALFIEFVFSFTGQPVSRAGRIAQFSLVLPAVLIAASWFNLVPTFVSDLAEIFILVPVSIGVSLQLLLWYRRGNREAGWLILPSLLPLTAIGILDLSGFLAWLGQNRLASLLMQRIPLGPILVSTFDMANLLFLLAIIAVMFLRFTRVSREQARSAAELDAARLLQRQLVPAALPNLPGISIEAAYHPANEVGGDFYQVLEQPGNAFLIVLGDVSGKGLKAAMTATLALGALRALASEALPPAQLLTRLNRELARSAGGGFTTCIALRISPSGDATMANAGHLSPYRNGAEIPLPSGLPLGIAAQTVYEEVALRLAPGDRITLLSDGVVEAQNPAGELFGFDRTAAISTQSADEIARAAQHFGQEDDITVLTLSLAETTHA
jgi:hypothetical protein